MFLYLGFCKIPNYITEVLYCLFLNPCLQHCVSVAVGHSERGKTLGSDLLLPGSFTVRTVPDLITDLSPLLSLGDDEWEQFLSLH